MKHDLPRFAHTPIAPWHVPDITLVQCGRHGVMTMGAAWPAAHEPEQSHPPAGPQAIAGYGFIGILGTGRQMPAGIADETGKGQLVQPDESRPEEPPRGLPPRAAPVAGISFSRGRQLIVCRVIAHRRFKPRLRRFSSRSGRGNPPPPRMSAWWNCAGPCSRARVQEISGLQSAPAAAPHSLSAF